MPEEGQKRSFARRFLVPRRPKLRHHGLTIGDELRALRRGLGEQGLICPNDGRRLKLIDVFEQETDETGSALPVSDATPVTRALGCDCGYHLPVEPIIAEAREQLGRLKAAEHGFVFAGVGIAMLAGAITIWNGVPFTLLLGLVFGLFLILRGLAFRYRHWLVSEGRLFETGGVPLGDWLRHEWRS